jgi:hypothetical protein
MSYLLMELIAQTAISHGDPGIHNDSNVQPFRMMEVLYERPVHPIDLEPDEAIGNEPKNLHIDSVLQVEEALVQFARIFPLPPTPITAALQQLNAEQFVASAFVMALISNLNGLNSGEGAGLFTGRGRYDMLLKRLSIVAAQFNTSFFTLYSSLLNKLHVTDVLPRMVDTLYRFAGLPRGIQQAAIAVLGKERHSVIMIARAWSDAIREQKNQADSEQEHYYNPQGKFAGTSMQDIEAAVPHISTNAFRHSVFREVLCLHLLQACGFGSVSEVIQKNLLPPFVIQLLSNGGNVKDGASPPDNREAMNAAIKRMFPSIELLSGCLPSHIMGEGMLKPANWTLCRQNNAYTQAYGHTRDIDAASLLTIATHTRQTPDGMESSREAGQMLFSHTVMKQGARILLKVGFHPFTSDLAKGAAYFALQEWLANGGQIGGREGNGEGHFQLAPAGISVRSTSAGESETLSQYEAYATLYQQYVASHKDTLREAMTTGSLGWCEPLKAR